MLAATRYCLFFSVYARYTYSYSVCESLARPFKDLS